MAVENNELLGGVLLGGKGGLQRVAARQWIDATESGELAQLVVRARNANWQSAASVRRLVHLSRHADWPELPTGPLPSRR